jgi:protein-S-isoprenylcysteine O-methyltransferase Ste14
MASQTLVCIVAGYLTYRCFTPPNPPPQTPYSNDHFGRIMKKDMIYARRIITLILWIYHAILTFTFPNPPTVLCPRPQNLSASVFTLNIYSVVCLSLILIAAPIRLLAFAQLEQNFTFQLATPKKLVTTGLYLYAQHPSYTTNLIVAFANALLLLRADGVMGCGLSTWVVRSRDVEMVGVVALVGLLAFSCWCVYLRVTDEEEMLRKAFGSEWEVYHKRTKRFVPGLF